MTSDEMGNADMTKGKGLNGEQKKKKRKTSQIEEGTDEEVKIDMP